MPHPSIANSGGLRPDQRGRLTASVQADTLYQRHPFCVNQSLAGPHVDESSQWLAGRLQPASTRGDTTLSGGFVSPVAAPLLRNYLTGSRNEEDEPQVPGVSCGVVSPIYEALLLVPLLAATVRMEVC